MNAASRVIVDPAWTKNGEAGRTSDRGVSACDVEGTCSPPVDVSSYAPHSAVAKKVPTSTRLRRWGRFSQVDAAWSRTILRILNWPSAGRDRAMTLASSASVLANVPEVLAKSRTSAPFTTTTILCVCACHGCDPVSRMRAPPRGRASSEIANLVQVIRKPRIKA